MTELEFGILNAIQNLHCPPLDAVMIFASYLGSCAVVWILAALLLLFRKDERKFGLIIALAMILGLLTGSLVLKHVFLRERPFNNPLGMLSAAQLFIPPPPDRYSFPSAHSVTSFAAAAGLFMWNKRAGAAALALAAVIAFSRIYLYVHFPTDILAGAVLGVLCAIAAKHIVDKFYKRKVK